MLIIVWFGDFYATIAVADFGRILFYEVENCISFFFVVAVINTPDSGAGTYKDKITIRSRDLGHFLGPRLNKLKHAAFSQQEFLRFPREF